MTRPRPGVDPVALRDLAAELAVAAGAFLRTRRPDELGSATKSSPTDLVTVMDQGAERVVRDGLHAARPGDSVLGEEHGSQSGTTGVRWIVDPLDGTVNYVYGIPAYGVSIAVEVDGVVVAGVVHDVTSGRTFEAVLDGGARVDGRPLACNQVDDLAMTMLGTGFAYDAATRAAQGRVLAEVLPRVRDIRRLGAAALDLCAVADGRLDAFYEVGLKPWDSAAGLLIAEQAGARTLDVQTPCGRLVVAAAPAVFEPLTELLLRLHGAPRRAAG